MGIKGVMSTGSVEKPCLQRTGPKKRSLWSCYSNCGPWTSDISITWDCCLKMQKNLRPIQAKSTFHFSQILRWFVGTLKFEKHCLNSSKWSAAEYMFYSECGRVYMFLHHVDPDCGDPSNPQTECQGGGAGRPVLGRASKFRPDTPQFPLHHQSYASITFCSPPRSCLFVLVFLLDKFF